MFEFLSKKFSSIFSRLKAGKITESDLNNVLEQVQQALLEADVPYKLVQEFTQQVKKETVGQQLTASLKPAEQLLKIVHAKLVAFFGGNKTSNFVFKIPSIVMVMGLQGSGKTTTIAKMAHHMQKEAQKRNKKRKILVASVDFYRPAAIDQLEQLAQKIDVSSYRAQSTDPVDAAKEILAFYKQHAFEILFLDTAGRMHVDNNMLKELQDIQTYLSPQHKLLVLDAMTGQESLNVAHAFDQAVGFESAVLTKMDSDTRGGAAFSFCYALKKPIAFIGTGEKVDNLDLFHPERVANRILDMGDMHSLIEQANEKIKQDEQQKVEQSFKSGRLNLEDFANQMAMMNKLGSLSHLMKYVPGMSGLNIPQDKLEQGETEMKRFRTILSSMTRKERIRPEILNGSRKLRIARGAGVQVSDINSLLTRFEQAQQYVKLMKKMGPFKQMFR